MQHSKLPKKIKKFRILLDSAFAKPSQFPRLSKKAHVMHCVHTLKLSPQAEDAFIYQKASENNCIVLTVNFDDFRKLVKRNCPGILGIESQLSTLEMDKKVAAFIKGKNSNDLMGKATKITSGD